MKKLSLLFLLWAQVSLLLAQNTDKYDQVLMLNGDEKIGTVTAVGDNDITFHYKGETLDYKFRKSDIFRIKYASGRTELFSTVNQGAGEDTTKVTTEKNLTVTPNSVAIIPFRFVSSNLEGNNTEEMGTQVQNDYYEFASQGGGKYTYQDPMKTNAILRKKGISAETIRSYEADELCAILGVEYVVLGTLERNKTGSSTTANASGSSDKNGNKENNSGTLNSNTSEEFKTTISVSVYNNESKKMFDQKKTSVWSSPTAYKSTLNYLIKRTPLYGK